MNATGLLRGLVTPPSCTHTTRRLCSSTRFATPVQRSQLHTAYKTRQILPRSQRATVAVGSGQVGQSYLSEELRSALDKFVTENKVVLFMKGNRNFPQCGFSNTTVQILNTFNVPYETVDILSDDTLRQGLKEYSQWPTFPQVYIDGEFYGGCDILIESYTNGELAEVLERAVNS